jgi:hypothetical protein
MAVPRYRIVTPARLNRRSIATFMYSGWILTTARIIGRPESTHLPQLCEQREDKPATDHGCAGSTHEFTASRV